MPFTNFMLFLVKRRLPISTDQTRVMTDEDSFTAVARKSTVVTPTVTVAAARVETAPPTQVMKEEEEVPLEWNQDRQAVEQMNAAQTGTQARSD
jgi:hypothetical protein